MRVSAILARSRNGVIGDGGGLPWHLPEDLRLFRRLTLHKPVVMGRRTWETLDGALPHRANVVLSRREALVPGARLAHTPEQALELAACAATESDEVMVVGGAEIYRALWAQVTTVYLTTVDADVEGDTRFDPDLSAFEPVPGSREVFPVDDRHALPFYFEIWRRRSTEPSQPS